MKEFSCSTEQVVHTGFSFLELLCWKQLLETGLMSAVKEKQNSERKDAELRNCWMIVCLFATTPFTSSLVLLSIVNIKQRSMKAPLRSWKVSRPSLFWSESMFLLIYQKQSYKTVIQYLMICRHTKHHTVLLTYNRPKLIFSLFIRHISMFRTLTAHFEAT